MTFLKVNNFLSFILYSLVFKPFLFRSKSIFLNPDLSPVSGMRVEFQRFEKCIV